MRWNKPEKTKRSGRARWVLIVPLTALSAAVVAAFALLAGQGGGTVSATQVLVTPTGTGNVTCAQLGLTEVLKIEGNALADGSFNVSQDDGHGGSTKLGSIELDITAENSENEPIEAAWTSTFGIDAVIVKGGGGTQANVSYYDGALSDTDLVPPAGAISHIAFCVDKSSIETPTVSKTATLPATGTGTPPKATETPTSTPTALVTGTPALTLTPTVVLTVTPTLPVTPTGTLPETATPLASVTPTSTPTALVTGTPALTLTPTVVLTTTPTLPVTPTQTLPVTATPVASATPTATPTPTGTPLGVTATPMASATPTATPTPTGTPLGVTATPSDTATPTATPQDSEATPATPTSEVEGVVVTPVATQGPQNVRLPAAGEGGAQGSAPVRGLSLVVIGGAALLLCGYALRRRLAE